MGQLRNIFFRGLITFLPVALTIYILYAGVVIVDNFLGSALRAILPAYIPGLGFVLTILLIFAFGLVLNNLMLGGIIQDVEKWLFKFPLIKTVYSPLRDLMNLFSKRGQKDLKSVVLVDLDGHGMKAIGLVTRESFKDLEGLGAHAVDKVAVYIPWSYGLGGLTFLVPKHKITPVDIPVDRALSLAITAWIKSDHEDEHPHKSLPESSDV